MSAVMRVLVVDDERIALHTTSMQLRDAGYDAGTAENAYVAREKLAAERWDVVLTDLRMPGMDGLELLKQIRRDWSDVDVVVATAFGTVQTAVSAMREGAADYLLKPFPFQELDIRLRRLRDVRESAQELKRLRTVLEGSCCAPGMVAQSPAMRSVCDRIPLLATSCAPLLVAGETGTGKEVVARAVHDLGPRRREPFVAIACGAIPRELAESQLFGHERGAFTGAIARNRGCFEQAHRGTILLDDVDDLPVEIQVKLLRVLQEGVVRRLGGDEDIRVDVRVVATTKIDLAQSAADGKFRTDLLYRLRGLEVRLPPLRERGDDVLLLAQHFLRVLAAQDGAAPKNLSPEAATAIRRHAWAGNVRELRRSMESALAFCEGQTVEEQHLPDYLRADGAVVRPFTLHLEGRRQVNLPELVRQFEEALVQWALEKAHGQQSKAAEILGLPRTTLQSKLVKPPGSAKTDD